MCDENPGREKETETKYLKISQEKKITDKPHDYKSKISSKNVSQLNLATYKID